MGEKPKSADLPTTRRPPATTGSPVVWSFNGESLGEEGNDREGRTTKRESPPASTSGPVDSKDLPVDSFFSAGDPSDKKRGKDGAEAPSSAFSMRYPNSFCASHICEI